ncbi:DUF1676 domain-containing protein Osi15 [Rhynchophorus ferrugineus]|uniref:Uncharacterized protein n=1 Tax=Rhynchophorus ferrugineus TaxID=354439 RepID=A0A834II19_RHYFE|nr:hypothetical protein GWI33_007065 [Rhynchophorus ferrugineus]
MFKLVLCLILSGVVLVCGDDTTSCSDSITCGEQQLSSYLKTLEDTPSIPVLGDTIVLEKDQSFGDEVGEGKEDIVDRSVRFLTSRSLKIKFPAEEARTLTADARGKKHKIRKYILPLLLVLKLKAAIILPILLSVIALVSFKGFGLSLAALAVAGTSALKNLLQPSGSKIEVVSAPIGHWKRSGFIEGVIPETYQYEYH